MAQVIQYQSGMSNGFFVIDGNTVIAVDGGAIYGAAQAETICKNTGISPHKIKLIIASHTHVDHTCNLDELRKLSGAPIAVHKAGKMDMVTAELPHVFPRCVIGDEIMAFAQSHGGMPDNYLPPITPDIVWEGSLDLNPYGVAGQVIYTPGHSLSDCCVLLEDGQAIVGDLICEDEFTHGKPTIAYFGYHPDRNKANKLLFSSLKKLKEADCTTLYAGHGGPFTRAQFDTALREAQLEANLQ